MVRTGSLLGNIYLTDPSISIVAAEHKHDSRAALPLAVKMITAGMVVLP